MRTLTLVVTFLLILAAPAVPQTIPARPALTIPRISAPPDFEAFLDMEPSAAATSGMVRVADFVQRWPKDGDPERMKTVAYAGYTADALHVVYLAFDPDPAALRAHLIRREDVFVVNDDEVELRLDTFGDGRQSYYFVSNALGVQLDAAWPEFEGQYDQSFDLVWHSRGQRTDRGFVVSMEIPFKSLRFDPATPQPWGVYFGRWIPRTGEWTFWPHISIRQQSFLAQMARLDGIRDVSRGKGVQLIPYVSARAFRALDTRPATGPSVVRDLADPSLGLDAKFILRGSLVVDATANPDFSQVESDTPQITANQRFEVFFPEKRPFFLENAGAFQTSINLLFTRRIADPRVGGKLTGKVGAWTVGILTADDEAPGKRAAAGDPAHGTRAWAAVARASRRLFGQSTLGAIATHRRTGGRRNDVLGLDGRVRIGPAWAAEGQYKISVLAPAGGQPTGRGSAYAVSVSRSGRSVTSRTAFEGRAAAFVTDLGFTPRIDVHQGRQSLAYTFRPGGTLNDWGPSLVLERVWAHDGLPLDWRARPAVGFNFARSTTLGGFAEASAITLRPGDAPNVATVATLRPDTWGVSASTSPQPGWSASMTIARGRDINFAPAGDAAPTTGAHAHSQVTLALRPLTPLRIETTWLRTTLGWLRTMSVAKARRPCTRRRLVRTDRIAGDAWQVFVKWSHLVRW